LNLSKYSAQKSASNFGKARSFAKEHAQNFIIKMLGAKGASIFDKVVSFAKGAKALNSIENNKFVLISKSRTYPTPK
jgi:hypothetical protein